MPYVTGITPTLGIREGDDEPKKGEIDLEVLAMPNGQTMSTFELVNGWINDPIVVKYLQEQAFTDAGTDFDFEIPLVKGITVSDNSGRKWPVVAIHVEGKCRKEIMPAKLSKYTYGGAAVTEGSAGTFGQPVKIVLIQGRGEPAKCIISVRKRPLSKD